MDDSSISAADLGGLVLQEELLDPVIRDRHSSELEQMCTSSFISKDNVLPSSDGGRSLTPFRTLTIAPSPHSSPSLPQPSHCRSLPSLPLGQCLNRLSLPQSSDCLSLPSLPPSSDCLSLPQPSDCLSLPEYSDCLSLPSFPPSSDRLSLPHPSDCLSLPSLAPSSDCLSLPSAPEYSNCLSFPSLPASSDCLSLPPSSGCLSLPFLPQSSDCISLLSLPPSSDCISLQSLPQSSDRLSLPSLPQSSDCQSLPQSSDCQSLPQSSDCQSLASLPQSPDCQSLPQSSDCLSLPSLPQSPDCQSLPQSSDCLSLPSLPQSPDCQSLPQSSDCLSLPSLPQSSDCQSLPSLPQSSDCQSLPQSSDYQSFPSVPQSSDCLSLPSLRLSSDCFSPLPSFPPLPDCLSFPSLPPSSECLSFPSFPPSSDCSSLPSLPQPSDSLSPQIPGWPCTWRENTLHPSSTTTTTTTNTSPFCDGLVDTLDLLTYADNNWDSWIDLVNLASTAQETQESDTEFPPDEFLSGPFRSSERSNGQSLLQQPAEASDTSTKKQSTVLERSREHLQEGGSEEDYDCGFQGNGLEDLYGQLQKTSEIPGKHGLEYIYGQLQKTNQIPGKHGLEDIYVQIQKTNQIPGKHGLEDFYGQLQKTNQIPGKRGLEDIYGQLQKTNQISEKHYENECMHHREQIQEPERSVEFHSPDHGRKELLESPKSSEVSRWDDEVFEAETRFTQIKHRPPMTNMDSMSDRYGKTFTDADSSLQSPQKESRRDANEPKRPRNGFIRYSVKHRSELSRRYPYKDNRSISKLLGSRWKKMTAEEKRPYEEAFSKDIHQIRRQHPLWRYAPARRSAQELVEPMASRLRPRDKIRPRFQDGEDSDEDWDWAGATADGSSRQEDCNRKSPLQRSATSWRQCDLCSLWRPLPGHVEAEDLPKTWECFMNPDQRFNVCGRVSTLPTAVPPSSSSSHRLPLLLQSSKPVWPQVPGSSCPAVLSGPCVRIPASPQPKMLLVCSSFPVLCVSPATSGVARTVLVGQLSGTV